MTSHQPFRLYLLLGFIIPLSLLSGCSDAEKTTNPVSYSQDVAPILQKYCLECHVPGGAGYQASGLDMSTYEAVMKGTKFGPVIKAGDSLSSTLVILVEGRADPSIKMPHGDRQGLSAEEIVTLRLWIDQGAVNN